MLPLSRRSALGFGLSGLVSAPLLAAPVRARSNGASDLASRIDAIHAAYSDSRSPGAIIAILKKGLPLFLKGYGLANREHGAPWTVETPYTFFSITKSMVALAMLRLEEAGLVKIEDSIHRFLPDFPRFAHDIKIKHLLNHTSGLWQDEAVALIAGMGLADEPVSLEELYSLMKRQRHLPYRPGTNYYYNDGGMRLAARILEKITGQTFADAMRRLVFSPAGMKTAAIKRFEPEYFVGQATPYLLDRQRNEDDPVRVAIGVYEYSGDGAGNGTMNDFIAYARYLTGLVDGVRWIDRLTVPHEFRPGYVAPYRYGLLFSSYRGLKVISHAGYMGKQIAYLPEQDLWILMMRNALDYYRATDARRLEQLMDAVLESSSSDRFYLSAANPLRDQAWLKPGNQKFRQAELRQLSGRFLEAGSGLAIELKPDRGGEFPQIEAHLLGRRAYLVRGPQPGSYDSSPDGSPNAVSIWLRDKTLYLLYADWPEPRPLKRVAGPVTLNAITVAELIGFYRSPELSMIYEVRQEGKDLLLLIGSGNRMADRFRMRPITDDIFEAMPTQGFDRHPMSIRLIRKEGRIVSLEVALADIQKLNFERLDISGRSNSRLTIPSRPAAGSVST